jgi:hypothetical protein
MDYEERGFLLYALAMIDTRSTDGRVGLRDFQ